MANPDPQKPHDDTAPDSTDRSGAMRSEDSTIQIAQYRILEQIGRGGMGVVFKAVHSSLQKTVAIKLLFGTLNSGHDTTRFTRESVALGKMNHPNVVTAFDAGNCAHGPYLVTEFVNGISLLDVVKRNGPLTLPAAARVALETAQGLQHIHGHGLVHRDIKPSNLMLTASGQVKILDLGIALLQFTEEELTGSGQILGTRDYMAPEQWLDSHKVDYRADIYGLACTLYFLLAGRAPYADPDFSSTDRMHSHLHAPFPMLHSLRPDVPHEFDRLLQQMATKEPERRFTDLAEIEALLKPWAANADLAAEYRGDRHAAAKIQLESISTPDATAVAGKKIASPRRSRWPIAGALLLVVALIAVGVGYFNFPDTQTNVPAKAPPPKLELPPLPTSIELIRSQELYRHESKAHGVDLSDDASEVMSASEDRSAKFCEIEGAKLLPWQADHPEPITDVAFLPGQKYATISSDGKLRVWSRENDALKEEFALPLSNAGGLTSLDVSPDGRWAAVGGWDKMVRIIDLKTQHEVAAIDAGEVVYDVAITANGSRVLAGGRDKMITVWDVTKRQIIHQLKGHEGWVMALDLSPDEQHCVSAGFDNTVRLWDVATGAELKKIDKLVAPKAVRFFCQGRLFVFGERSGEIQLWNPAETKPLLKLKDSGAIDALDISPLGETLISGTDNGTIKLWQLLLR